MHRQIIIPLVLMAGILLFLTNTLFVVNPAEQAIVFQFRESKRVIQKEGLYAKIPFIQDVTYFERRVLPLEPSGQRVTLSDQKILDVDGFARWRIKDPLTFMQSLRDENKATERLGGFLNSSLRNVLGNYQVADLLSEKRDEIMNRIKEEMNTNVVRYGVEVVDVRIRRTDLPPETVQNVYSRMRSERQKEAATMRAEGEMKAVEIRSKADADRTRKISEAQRDSQKLRGEGDKIAIQVMADAMNKDPQFYSYYRTLEAYRTSLRSDNTSYLLSPDSKFFEVFGKPADR
ncbi:MAG: protease modulator HflC [Alphaproteobacteria bacterium]|nr:protease modulator HflC [Alphaproteobacteria bacterium]